MCEIYCSQCVCVSKREREKHCDIEAVRVLLIFIKT